MNWPLYKTHKKKILWAFVANTLFLLTVAIIFLPKVTDCKELCKAAKLKSRLKQIGTVVAAYFEGQENLTYPKDPNAFEINSNFFYTDKTNSWYDVNLNSPYYFFPDENFSYTGLATVPLATNWEPIMNGNTEYFAVAWEDGHVSHVTREEQLKLFQSTYKGRVTKELYDLSEANNQALQ